MQDIPNAQVIEVHEPREHHFSRKIYLSPQLEKLSPIDIQTGTALKMDEGTGGVWEAGS